MITHREYLEAQKIVDDYHSQLKQSVVSGSVTQRNNYMTTHSSIAAMQDVVADIWMVDPKNLATRCRKAPIAEARQFLMYIHRIHDELTFSQIGELYKKDHSTVFYAVKQAKLYIEVDRAFRRKAQKAIVELKKRGYI